MNDGGIKIRVLGSGTSSGVPTVGCRCATCLSEDPRDKRLRPSIQIMIGERSLLVDTSSDFREQCLKYNIRNVDAVLYTHHHFDHIAGFDDLRAFNFITRKAVPIYLTGETFEHLKRIFAYAFEQTGKRENSTPVVDVNIIDKAIFEVKGITCIPVPLKHGSLNILGYRFGNFAYCTDCNRIGDEGWERLKGVEYLILDGLRYRNHPTHLTIEEAIEIADKLETKRTWLTHIAHDVKHEECEKSLPENVRLAYDGLCIEIDKQGEMKST